MSLEGIHPNGLGERRRVVRRNHELLEIDRIVCVPAAVEDVHAGRYKGRPWAFAAARALAMETARIALAPSFPWFGVPSSWIMSRWSPAWSEAFVPPPSLRSPR